MNYNSSFTPQNIVQRSSGVNCGPSTVQNITRDRFEFIPRSIRASNKLWSDGEYLGITQ